jgi:hypothetical protein
MNDDFDGKDLRDKGMRLVLANEKAEYREAYYAEVELEFNKLPVDSLFLFEKLNELVRAKIGPPHHHNAISSMSRVCVNRWLEEGRIENAGTSLANKASSHATLERLYRKLQ